MLTEQYYDKCDAHSTELYAAGREGDMWSEAQAQCLDSWLECGDEYTDEEFDDLIMDHLDYKTQCWLEGHMDNYTAAELAEGGYYHWMPLALEHRDSW